ncbi:NPCBM/NEW2 domain-containing protein [Myxococcota bacterium]
MNSYRAPRVGRDFLVVAAILGSLVACAEPSGSRTSAARGAAGTATPTVGGANSITPTPPPTTPSGGGAIASATARAGAEGEARSGRAAAGMDGTAGLTATGAEGGGSASPPDSRAGTSGPGGNRGSPSHGGGSANPSLGEGATESLGSGEGSANAAGADGFAGAQTDPETIETESTETTWYLSDLCHLNDSTNGWGPFEKDRSNGEEPAGDGGRLTLDGKRYSKGLGAHAPSDIGYTLAGRCSDFSAAVGVDDEMADAGSVVFEVWGDGSRLYRSAVMTGAGRAASAKVDITGVQELRLVVSDNGGNGSDHADWAEAQVSCATEPPAACDSEDSASGGSASEDSASKDSASKDSASGGSASEDSASEGSASGGEGADRPSGEAPTGYRLVWSDEFDVDGRPNPDDWGYEQGFARNEELQWYQEDNARVEGGYLIIEGRRERVSNPNYRAGSEDWKTHREYAEYTSSSLRTMGKQSWQYGVFEMRARIVTRAGLWPAWWTLGVSGEWPQNGEIDIMEYYNSRVHANVACGTSERWVAKWDGANRQISSFGVSDWDAAFHVWRMDWDERTITLALDGEEMNTTDLDDMLNPDGRSPFRQPHYMLINLAIGGKAGGDPSGTEFPSRYEIDYVRVYQRE